MIGKTILQYQILEYLGGGGMGDVYKARDTRLKRTVALKFLPTPVCRDEREKRRFFHEAQAASALEHENICTVHEIGETDDGKLFIAMAFYEGETLKERLARGPLPLDEALDIALKIAAGLARVHQMGIVHRDIKPGNIMLTEHGGVKIMDFGLAKVNDSSMTETGSTVGTIAYMSPEQIEGRKVDGRADIFSFGVVLYELVTGHLPFIGEHVSALIHSILNLEPEPIETYRDSVPRKIRTIIFKCLQKEPGLRWQTMDDVISAFSADTTVQKPIVKTISGKHEHKKRRLTILAGAAMALISAAPDILAHNGNSTYLISNRSERQLTFIGEPICAAWSPDGRYIAYPTNTGIYLSPSEGGASRRLGDQYNLAVAWSWTPDSRSVLAHVVCEGVVSVAKLGINGEAPQILADSALFASASPDGKKILVTSLEKKYAWCIVEMDLESGDKRLIARPFRDGAATYKGVYSPDGKKISYIRWNGVGHELWVMNRDGSDDHRVKTEPLQVGGHYSWAPDGKSIIIAGKLGHAWYIWSIALNGKRHIRLTTGSAGGRHVSAAPDGKSFAFQKEHDMSRICIIDVESREKSYPIDLDIGTQHPAFSRDGNVLYFQTMVNGHWQIRQKDLRNSTPPRIVIAADMQSCFSPVTTPDQKILYIRSSISQENRHGVMDWSQTLRMSSADGGGQTHISRVGDRVERISPTPFQNDYLLYSVNVPDALFKERVYALPPEPEREPQAIFTTSQNVVCSSFDWGEEHQVLIAHSDSTGAELARTISAFDIRSQKQATVCHLDSVQLNGGRGIAGHIQSLALAPNRRMLAMIVIADKARLILYDLPTKRMEEIMEFDEKASPNYLVWSRDNNRLAVEMNRFTTDIFISEPMKYIAVNK